MMESKVNVKARMIILNFMILKQVYDCKLVLITIFISIKKIRRPNN